MLQGMRHFQPTVLGPSSAKRIEKSRRAEEQKREERREKREERREKREERREKREERRFSLGNDQENFMFALRRCGDY